MKRIRNQRANAALDQNYLDFQIIPGKVPPSRHQAEGHPQVLIIARRGRLRWTTTCGSRGRLSTPFQRSQAIVRVRQRGASCISGRGSDEAMGTTPVLSAVRNNQRCILVGNDSVLVAST